MILALLISLTVTGITGWQLGQAATAEQPPSAARH